MSREICPENVGIPMLASTELYARLRILFADIVWWSLDKVQSDSGGTLSRDHHTCRRNAVRLKVGLKSCAYSAAMVSNLQDIDVAYFN